MPSIALTLPNALLPACMGQTTSVDAPVPPGPAPLPTDPLTLPLELCPACIFLLSPACILLPVRVAQLQPPEAQASHCGQ